VDGKGRGEPDQYPLFERDLAVPLDLPVISSSDPSK
jgi:hypothetical protein